MTWRVPVTVMTSSSRVSSVSESVVTSVASSWAMATFANGSAAALSSSMLEKRMGVRPALRERLRVDIYSSLKVFSVFEFPKILPYGYHSRLRCQQKGQQIMAKLVLPLANFSVLLRIHHT